MTKYNRSRGSVFTIKYHIVWSPKYRRKILKGEYAETLRVLLYEKAEQIRVSIEALEIMPDHVHLFVSVKPSDDPAKLVNHFKGYTSYWMRRKHPGLGKRFRVLWSPSYYVGSVGHVTDETVKRYIENQKS